MPKSKEQFEQIRNERINMILESALYLFATKGYDAVNLDEVTKQSNCSHGLLYHYFKGKDDLYLATINEIVIPYMREITKDINFNQKAKFAIHDILEAILKKIKAVDDRNALIIYLFLNIHLQKNLFGKAKNERMITFLKVLELVERGQKEGDITGGDPKDIAFCFVNLLKGIYLQYLTQKHPSAYVPSVDNIMQIFNKKSALRRTD